MEHLRAARESAPQAVDWVFRDKVVLILDSSQALKRPRRASQRPVG